MQQGSTTSFMLNSCGADSLYRTPGFGQTAQRNYTQYTSAKGPVT